MPPFAPESQVGGFISSLKRTAGPDFTIILGDHTWRVHLDLLRKHSSFFEIATNGKWKEGEDRSIEIHDDDPATFGRFLQWIYCGSYDGGDDEDDPEPLMKVLTLDTILGNETATGKDVDGHARLTQNAMLYELAEKYGCVALQDFARDEIVDRLSTRTLFKMCEDRHPCEWIDLIRRDEGLTKGFATFIVSNRVCRFLYEVKTRMRSLLGRKATQREEQLAGKWLRCIKEDHYICVAIIEALENI